MSDLFDEPGGATPLGPDERNGLLPTWVTDRSELNEVEHINVAAGTAWAQRQRRRDILTGTFVTQLHGKLFGDVWAWAGNYRRIESNLGIEPAQVPAALHTALDDARYWVGNETYPPDEIAVRLHHRLVAIHPFPNGNGRTTRLMADLLAVRLGRDPFTWGRVSLTDVGETRAQYFAALRAADSHDIGPLLAFARS